MDMKRILRLAFAATWLFSMGAVPLLAQTNAPAGGDNNGSFNINFSAHGATWAGVLFVLILPAAVLAVVFYFARRPYKLMHKTVRAMIEKGMPVTPELIASLNVKAGNGVESRQTRHLLPGLVLVGAGFGLMILAGKAGWIVLFVGLAFLIVWLVERKQQGVEPPPKP